MFKINWKNVFFVVGGYDILDGIVEVVFCVDFMFVRWVNNKDGSKVFVLDEMLVGFVGRVFIKGGLVLGRMVEEVF